MALPLIYMSSPGSDLAADEKSDAQRSVRVSRLLAAVALALTVSRCSMSSPPAPAFWTSGTPSDRRLPIRRRARRWADWLLILSFVTVAAGMFLKLPPVPFPVGSRRLRRRANSHLCVCQRWPPDGQLRVSDRLFSGSRQLATLWQGLVQRCHRLSYIGPYLSGADAISPYIKTLASLIFDLPTSVHSPRSSPATKPWA